MEKQLEFDYGDTPNIPRELIIRKWFDYEYETAFLKHSVDTNTMTNFFKNVVRKLMEKYEKKR